MEIAEIQDRPDRRRRRRPQRIAGAAVRQAKASASRSPRAKSKSSARSAPRPAPAPLPATPPTPDEVERLFGLVEREIGAPDLVVYNASGRARGAFVDLVPAEVAQAIAVSAFGGFLVAQQAAKRMLPNRHGAILFTGASASVKGYPQSAPFAMGKFALRGLAQSMARELSPQGIHVAHFVIDGGIRSAARTEPADRPDSMLDPDAIALSYWNVLQQPRSAWTWELELRPWVEKF